MLGRQVRAVQPFCVNLCRDKPTDSLDFWVNQNGGGLLEASEIAVNQLGQGETPLVITFARS